MDLNLKLRIEDFHSHWCISDRNPIVIPVQAPFSLDNQFASISEMFTNSEPHQRIDMMLLLNGLRANPLPAIVDNPLVSVTRGRPAGALNNSRPMVRDNSTTRDSSAFEFVEGTVNSRRKCGNAGNGNPDVPCRSISGSMCHIGCSSCPSTLAYHKRSQVSLPCLVFRQRRDVYTAITLIVKTSSLVGNLN